MTTVTTAEAPARNRPRRPLAPSGLTWTLLRVHRSALWFWIMYVAVTAAVLLWLYGPGAHAAMDELVRSRCRDAVIPELDCDSPGPAGARWDAIVVLAGSMIALAPVLIATWAGGSLIGRALEDGTARLAWAQSVSPTRWLAAQLAVPAVLITAGMLPLTLLHRMMWTAHPELRPGSGNWFDSRIFDANGIVATVASLFGLAFGVLVGMVARRSMTGLGVSLGATGFGLGEFRSLVPYLWPAETRKVTVDFSGSLGMPVGEGSYTATGARLPDVLCGAEPSCVARHHIVGEYRDYHPAAHFWPLQLVETGVLLTLAALAALTAFALLRRRTGASV
ncbi:ABC transporter permease [Streptomyces sp. NPDC005474]|uniref:ABC transporter permease n=1 Tax=Streptomyces sp. NPDC005474 TaxID=3154878 RepID=UPI0034536187